MAKMNGKQSLPKYRKAQVAEKQRIKTKELRAIMLESTDQKKVIIISSTPNYTANKNFQSIFKNLIVSRIYIYL